MDALKEWATVVKALEDGQQTIILRKGGLQETASGFKVVSSKFFLFPTWEHQKPSNIKPEYHHYLDQVASAKPKEGFNVISSYAEVLADADLKNQSQIDSLSSFHIWSDSYIHERMNWLPEKPLKAVFLKVYKISPQEISLLPQYQGCKSWIDINAKKQDGEAVLSKESLSERLALFKEAIS